MSDYKQAVQNLDFEHIDLTEMREGVYSGECDVDLIYAKVEVTVQSGEIASINILEHKNGRGAAAEAVIGRIIEEQKIDVDTISGATNSSQVLKKAVESALKNAAGAEGQS